MPPTFRPLPRSTDVLIVGGGVTGASVFHEASMRGHSALLVDKGDFASGTSQASGMLAWGGLLYLRNLEFRTVRKLSRARDEWIAGRPDEVQVAPFRYLPLRSGGRSSTFVRLALETYWHLGGRRRARPFRGRGPASFLKQGRFGRGLAYEEAAMVESDARVTLDRVLGAFAPLNTGTAPPTSPPNGPCARNHCELVSAGWNDGHWEIQLHDRLTGEVHRVRAKSLVNAAGVWADGVASLASIRTEHRHALSKGVYLVLRKPKGLDHYLAFEMGEHGDTLTLTPWGPTALWGPTETLVDSIEGGFAPTVDDVRFLLEHASRNLETPLVPEDVLALRCGIRPLAVRKGDRRAEYPLDLSRKHAIDVDEAQRAITLFGGKFTSSATLAKTAMDRLERVAPLGSQPAGEGSPPRKQGHSTVARPMNFRFADHKARWIDPAYARDHEACPRLMDYLRRRTSIAQWTPRMGLGARDKHLDGITALAAIFEGERAPAAVQDLVAAANLQDEIVECAFMGP